MKVSTIVVFVVTYGAFLLSGFLFRIDLPYYNALAKPALAPPGYVIGIVWTILFTLISLSVALLDAKVGIANIGLWLAVALVGNWFFNQAYSYIQFVRKDWLLAAFDSGILTLTGIVFIALAWKVNRTSAWLFVPYTLWTAFATYLSAAFWALNR